MKNTPSPLKIAARLAAKHRCLLAILALALVMLQLVACNPVVTRPDDWTTPKNQPDIPVITPPVDTTPKKRVALTFDDGPQHYAERTKAIVDEMDKYGFHCTFFVLGNRVRGGDALAYAVAHGNDIGIHSFDHPNFNQIDDAAYQNQLSNTVDRIHEKVPDDYEVKLLRPPYGNISDERLAACPYAVINWSVDSLDWENTYYSGISDEEADRRVNTIVENVMSQVGDGDIILMHDIYESTYDATVLLLQRLHEEGYEVVSVTELLGDRLQAGRMYYNG